MIKIAILASNLLKIDKTIKKGTEIFVYTLVKHLSIQTRKKLAKLKLTVFTSGNSELPETVQLESIRDNASVDDKDIGPDNALLFELSLFSKAFSKQKQFDIFHVNHNNNADLVLPFARFVKKPIIVTLHGNVTYSYKKKYYESFNDVENVHLVSISHQQQKILSTVKFTKNIYHGIDIKKFTWNPNGGDFIMWAGRNAPEKGLDTAIKVIQKTEKKGKIFPIIKQLLLHKHVNLANSHKNFMNELSLLNKEIELLINFNLPHTKLIKHYQTSKVFLFPIKWEEPFGFVMIESMACGTPVVAYARGSTAEVIQDGVTGFLVNPSDDDIRGDFIIKSTGKEGLCEAIERIYAMSSEDYKNMRLACRNHVEKYFTVERMIQEYIDLYNELHAKYS